MNKYEVKLTNGEIIIVEADVYESHNGRVIFGIQEEIKHKFLIWESTWKRWVRTVIEIHRPLYIKLIENE